MNGLRQMIVGLLAGLLSSVLILGSLTVSLAEGVLRPAIPPSLTPNHVGIASVPPEAPTKPTAAISLPTVTATEVPPPTSCPPPAGWVVLTLQVGDRLDDLARTYSVTIEALAQANCLLTHDLLPGTYLYIPNQPTLSPSLAYATSTRHPPAPTRTKTVEPCGPPAGWVLYTVHPGDTLFGLSQVLSVDVSVLQLANCMGSSTVLGSGQSIYVPFAPVHAPTAKPPKPTATQRPPATTMPPATTEPPATTQPPVVTTEPPPVTTEPSTEPPTEPPVATTESPSPSPGSVVMFDRNPSLFIAL